MGNDASLPAQELLPSLVDALVDSDKASLEAVQRIASSGKLPDVAKVVDAKGRSGLFHAAWRDRGAAAKILLADGADPNSRDSAGGNTPLLIAASMGHHDMVKILIDRGADAFAANDDGWTALVVARDNGHDAVVRLLRGCDDVLGNGSARLPQVVGDRWLRSLP